jgi:hypothetical protein
MAPGGRKRALAPTRQGQQARQGGAQYPDSQEGGADEFPAILFTPLGAKGRARQGGSLLL